MDEENKAQEQKKTKKTKRIKLIGISLIVLLAILIGGIIVYYFSIKENVRQWGSKIYPGITIENTDVSGKTKEEAEQLLKDKFGEAILDKKLIVKAENDQIEINYKDLDPSYNIVDVVSEALNYGKNLNLFEQNLLTKKGTDKSYKLEFKFNEEKLKEFEEQLTKKVDKDPKNSTIRINRGNISITDSSNGRKINQEEMDKLIKESINGNVEETIEVNVPVETVKPTRSKSELSEVDGKIATFTTDYSSSTENRATNVEIAVKAINGKLLMPGETFAYNETVGPRTKARGFKDAAVFVGDKVEDGIGGGICQVSTTLYRAVMNAGIKSVERKNHSMKTSYSPVGLDAVVAWGYLDYKFKNTYDFPIYIEGIASNRKITFNIYGNVKGMGGKSYGLEAGPVTTLNAKVNRVNDSNLPSGTEKWEKKPVDGYKVSSYLVTYQNGKQINREFIATDNYIKSDGVLRVGTR